MVSGGEKTKQVRNRQDTIVIDVNEVRKTTQCYNDRHAESLIAEFDTMMNYIELHGYMNIHR